MTGVVEAASGPPPVPTVGEFVLSPGFVGAGIAVAAIVALVAVLYASRRASRRHDHQLDQQDRHQQEGRADRDRAAGIDRCWHRLVWLIDTASIEPAGLGLDHSETAILGLSPELTLAILKGLHRDATALGDETLIDAATVYLTQFGAVLAQEGGPVPETKVLNGHKEPPKTAESPTVEPPEQETATPTAAASSSAPKSRRRA